MVGARGAGGRLRPHPPRSRLPDRLLRPTRLMASLRDLATARSGDKGDTATLGVVCRDPANYPLLADWLTAERVAAVPRSGRARAGAAV
ncbi:MAG: hypothetical protein RML45_00565 [Acetobacteraceae bacterium]|nr:hypothetical protein [Acetobacteraceae bacterium]